MWTESTHDCDSLWCISSVSQVSQQYMLYLKCLSSVSTVYDVSQVSLKCLNSIWCISSVSQVSQQYMMYLKCLDPIPSHLLQAISPTLLPALTHIINTSLLTGIFPTAFKKARVTPLLKKPTWNTSLLENYRPVSLLPFIAKTLERVVFKQVSLFLSQNNKLDAVRLVWVSKVLRET